MKRIEYELCRMADTLIEQEAKIEGVLRRMAMLYGWSQLTVEAYLRDIITFHRFVSQHSSLSAFTAQQKQVTAYLGELQQRGLANSSIQRMRSAMATWFHYLQNENIEKITVG